jgi:hypothetical protein
MSLVKSLLEAAVCNLSDEDTLSFTCPDFSCPADAEIHGYPFIGLPNGIPLTKSRNGFIPVQATQYPPPGSIRRFGSTTPVTITATDANNRTLACTWNVIVPPLVQLGTVELNVTTGTYNNSAPFQRLNTVVSGTAYKMKGILQDRIRGKGTVQSRLQKGSHKYDGTAITLSSQKRFGRVNFNLPIWFTFDMGASDLAVNVNVVKNTDPSANIARYIVFGQAGTTL